MNQELPRPVRNALARQAGGEVHPSPDVLTSFVERTLPRDEWDLITQHLTLCADCREVVFLASRAAEDVIGDEKEVVPAATHQPVPTPVYGIVHHQPAVLAETPRRRWTLGLSWAVMSVAVLLVAGVLVWQRFGSVNPARQPVSSVASNRQPSGVPQPAASGMPSASETLGKTDRAKTTLPKTASPKVPGAVAGGALMRKGGEEYPPEPSAAASANESTETPPWVQGGPKIAASVPDTHNAFVESQANTSSQSSQGAAVAKPAMSMRAFNAARGQWRISADGHLERRREADGWTRVLVNEATTFRCVVSVAGGDVWAGGEGGTLFHSSDGGQHWSQVPLVDSSGAETGPIVTIQFQDSQRGTVLTAGGSRWSTSDGGVTWTSQ